MVRRTHPVLPEMWIHGFVHGDAPCFLAVRSCQQELADANLEMPSWTELSESPPVVNEESEPNQPKVGWQQKATRQTEHKFIRDEVWPGLDDSHRAHFRSQHGPLASAPFKALPTRVDAQPFRILLCRRLHLPLPLTLRTCRCGRQLDMFGHHRAACAQAGVLGRRGYPLEVAAAQRLELACPQKRLRERLGPFGFQRLGREKTQVVADGLTLFRGAQFAIDATMVSPSHLDGTARRRAADVDGAALEAEERTYLELSGDGGRVRLVVLAAEVGSTETAQFLSALAKARALSTPQALQGRVEAAWIRRWSAILAVHFPCPCWTSARFHRLSKFFQHTKCCG